MRVSLVLCNLQGSILLPFLQMILVSVTSCFCCRYSASEILYGCFHLYISNTLLYFFSVPIWKWVFDSGFWYVLFWLNLLLARIFQNFPRFEILKKINVYKGGIGVLFCWLWKHAISFFQTAVLVTWAHLLASGWCLSGKQTDERKQTSTDFCQTEALWNATELDWNVFFLFSIVGNVDKL